MFSYQSSGDLRQTESFLKKLADGDIYAALDRAGQAGVAALRANTPVDSGATASAWSYKAERSRNGAKITWYNSNRAGGTSVAILLQYGHGTGTGGYVRGRDYINPAMKPIFDKISNDVWKAVKSA